MGWLKILTDALYGGPLLVGMIGIGIYFTATTGVVQLRGLRKGIRALKDGGNLRAMLISTGARAGTGNVAGVAAAIAVGGAGSIFWMWVMAVIGAASSFAESVLAQKYRRRNCNGWVGGAAFYMRDGLRSQRMGMVFTLALIVCFGGAMNALQAYQAGCTMSAYGVPPMVSAVVLTALTVACICRDSSGRWSEYLVPAMTVGYLFLAFAIMVMRRQQIPDMLRMIVQQAFELNSVAGGLAGSALSVGIRRGLFTNEAGMGSASQAAASADARHPADQGMAQVFSVFIDTLVLCSATAFVLLLSDVPPDGHSNIGWVQVAVNETLGGWAGHLVSAAVLCFAFTSILGGYYYADSACSFVNNPALRRIVRVLCPVTVFVGTLAQAEFVWLVTDLSMGIMTALNLVALWRLRRDVKASIRDW